MSTEYCVRTARSIDNGRDIPYIFNYAQGEMQELKDELPSGGEDLDREAIDVMVNMIDIIQMNNPEMSPEEVDRYINYLLIDKTHKWVRVHGNVKVGETSNGN